MGVTGGEPIGFDVGAKGAGGTLRGLDLVSESTSADFVNACSPGHGLSCRNVSHCAQRWKNLNGSCGLALSWQLWTCTQLASEVFGHPCLCETVYIRIANGKHESHKSCMCLSTQF